MPYLRQRWDEGCTKAARLFAEITAQGHRGSPRSVRRRGLDDPKAFFGGCRQLRVCQTTEFRIVCARERNGRHRGVWRDA